MMRKLTARSGKEKPDALSAAERSTIALLGALCIFLSALDHLIPKPLPFMRLGLANLPLLLALDVFSARPFFLLVFVKVLGQALVTGTLFSYAALFSLAGTILSALTMFLLRRSAVPGRAYLSLVGISIAGAFVSNAAQLVLARFIVFGEGILYLAPPFLTAGIVSGGLLGFFAERFSAASTWLRLTREKTPSINTAARVGVSLPADAPVKTTPLFRYALLFLLAAVFLIVPDLSVRAALFLLFWILAIAAGKKTRPLFTLAGIAVITICNLFPPFGKILFRIGPFIITEGSLLRGLQRAVTMEGLVMLSRAALSSIPRLPGKTGKLIEESFIILDRMNELFFFKNRESAGAHTKKNIAEKLDDLLCEVSGYKTPS